MVNIGKLMKQAQAFQQKMTQDMEEMRVEASSGGGVVSVTMNGKKDLLSVSIKKEAVDPDDLEMLEDLVKAAVNEAARLVDERVHEQLGGLLPPGLGFPPG
jgi:hypothetical protein